MRKIMMLMSMVMLVMAAGLLNTSCGTVPLKDMNVSFTDGSKNSYGVNYTDDEDSKQAGAIVTVGEKTYGCFVDYKDAAPDAMRFSVDVSAAELTGCIKFTYKRVTVECKVTDRTKPEEMLPKTIG